MARPVSHRSPGPCLLLCFLLVPVTNAISPGGRISARPDVRTRNVDKNRSQLRSLKNGAWGSHFSLSSRNAQHGDTHRGAAGCRGPATVQHVVERRKLKGSDKAKGAEFEDRVSEVTGVRSPAKGAQTKGRQQSSVKGAQGRARYSKLLGFLESLKGSKSFVQQVQRTGFDRILKWLLDGYNLTLFVPQDAHSDFSGMSRSQAKAVLGLHTSFGRWNFDLLRRARVGGKLVTAALVAPKHKPTQVIYRLSAGKPKVLWGRTSNSMTGITIIQPNVFEDDSFIVHIVDTLLNASGLVKGPSPTPSPVPVKSPPPIRLPPPPPPTPSPTQPVPAPKSRPSVGLVRYNKLLNFLVADGSYNSFVQALESTGYNNTLAKILGLFQVTILLPRNVPLPVTPNIAALVQILGLHVLFEQVDDQQLQLLQPGNYFSTFSAFPPVFNRPSVSLYKIKGPASTTFSADKAAKRGAQVVETNVFVLPQYFSAHAMDSWLSPQTFLSDPNMATPLVPGALRYARLISWLSANSTLKPYLDSITSSGYNNTLADIIPFYSITILLPLNMTAPDGYTSRTFVIERLGLHVLVGDFNRKALGKLFIGDSIPSCFLFPPSPAPGQFMYRARTKPISFSGNLKLSQRTMLLAADVYTDAEPSGSVRVHLVNGLTVPDQYYVVSV